MLTTSAEYQTKINSNARKLYGKIVINYTDALLDPTINATSTDENYISWTQQLVNGRVDMTYKYFELDGIATLDNNYVCAPSTSDLANFNEFGWWSLSRASATGVINTSAQILFDSKRSMSAFFLACDDARNEYAVDFTVKFYNDATLVYTSTVTGNTQNKLTVSFSQIFDINKAVINITKWSTPNTPVKVAEFTTQVVEEYTDETLCSFNVIEEREISNDNSIPVGNISSSQASICLINSENRKFDANNTLSRLYNLVKPNAKVEIYLGVDTTTGIEYAPIFKGWATEWDVQESDKRANTTARDRLDLLTQTSITTSSVQANKTFKEWFEIVLNDAGLANTEYSIDTNLNGTDYIVPYGWFTDVTHRKALEILAQGCSSVVYVDRLGVIQVKLLTNFNPSIVKNYTRADYSDKNNQPLYLSIVNDVSVTTSPLVKNGGTVVYETNTDELEEIGATTSKEFIVYYTEAPVSDQFVLISPAVSGLTITNTNHYSWGSIITVANSGTAKTFGFNITGSTYTIAGQKTVNKKDQASIDSNGKHDFKYPQTPFLQNKKLADIIATDLLSSFKDAQRDLSLSFDVGGNPTIELGDTISVTDRYTTKSYKIISSEINYEGGLSMTHKGRV